MDNNKEQCEFIDNFNFIKDPTNNPKRGVGINTLYVRRKGCSYFLLDMNNNFEGKEDNSVCNIHTNEESKYFNRIQNKNYLFKSDRKKLNQKFVISQFVTSFFKHQSAISSQKQKYYFKRIHDLLHNKWLAINHRLLNNKDNNKQTKTYIKFSVRHTIFYLGFYIKCNTCNIPIAAVKSHDRRECYQHWKQL